MTIDNDKITEIFCIADDFCRLYDRFIKINGLARKRDKSNLMAGLAAYSFFPKKPMIDIERVSPCENGLIQLFLF